MNRMLAIVEREMRKFFRSPVLMIMSMMLPLVQLVILGNAFGGNIRGAHVAVVDYDHGPQAVKVREAFDAVAVNIATFTTVHYDDESQAREDVRTGKVDAAVIIPAHIFSAVSTHRTRPSIGLVVDNSDQFMSRLASSRRCSPSSTRSTSPSSSLASSTTSPSRSSSSTPIVEYMKYLLSGSIALAMYISVMIGGGMLYIDDKARGVHEGYLVTPITKLELVMGLNIAGAIKAVLAGISPHRHRLAHGRPRHHLPSRSPISNLLLLILGTSIAFNGMMFLMMVRVDDPLVPRAMFGVLNTLLFFPSGAIYPIAAFPALAARHRHRRPLHLRHPRLQGHPAQGRRLRRHPIRPAFPVRLRHRHAADRHAALQAHAVMRPNSTCSWRTRSEDGR